MEDRSRLLARATGALALLSLVLLPGADSATPTDQAHGAGERQVRPGAHESPATVAQPASGLLAPSPWLPRSLVRQRIERDGFLSVQVNVDDTGANIWGDAANEPTIAVDPTCPGRMAIAWRQFDSVLSDYRTLGVASSNDGGRSWQPGGSPDPGAFRTDPVLAAGSDGTFYLYSLGEGVDHCELLISSDGGRTWSEPATAFGGDKPWLITDTIEDPARSAGAAAPRTHVYAAWSDGLSCCGDNVLTRSTDGGATFSEPVSMDPIPIWGTLAIGPGHELYMAGVIEIFTIGVARWETAGDPAAEPALEVTSIPLDGGFYPIGADANPAGLAGQIWIVADTSDGPQRGNLYVLAPIESFDDDPLDLHLLRSTDGGVSWDPPIRIPTEDPGQQQWFGTLSVAPTGRLDVVWVESLDLARPQVGELHWSSSSDGGDTWSPPVAITPPFDSHVGWPVQKRLGDYYHMVSDATGVDLAYAATFNGEQDIYFLRLGPLDCNRNGVADTTDIATGASADCDADQVPDRCELDSGAMADLNENGIPDACDPPPPPRRPTRRVVPEQGSPTGKSTVDIETMRPDLPEYIHVHPGQLYPKLSGIGVRIWNALEVHGAQAEESGPGARTQICGGTPVSHRSGAIVQTSGCVVG
jgi:hypothetical protein